MQMVINIDDKIYEAILDGWWPDKTISIKQLVAKGKPLPKGHKKLIAEPTEEEIAKTIGGNNDFADCIRDAVKTVFENAQTIIESDVN